MLTLRSSCSHPGCRCKLETRYVFSHDHGYCSADCAEGLGCGHETCECGGREKREPPGFTSFIQGAVRHLHNKQ